MTQTRVSSVDYHTGGEPFRIVTDVPPLSAPSVAAKRVEAIDSTAVDGLRALLCSEPRGHADMYGGFVVEPDDDGADFGVLFWHKDGFSTACGHGTIALGAWALQTGRVAADPDGPTDVVIDVPSGRVTARVSTNPTTGRVTSVDFANVASYVLHDRVEVSTSRGPQDAVISFGGAIYAHVDAAALGLEVSAADLPELIRISREIKAELNGTPLAEHPSDPRLSGIYGVIYYEDLGEEAGNPVQRNVTVFADGEVDRSPCGSGTCSRIATLAAQGSLHEKNHLVHHSIVGSTFIGKVVGRAEENGYPAVMPLVTGTAYQTGEHTFLVDPDDSMVPGFVLR